MKVLVMVNMQNGFINRSSGAKNIVPVVVEKLKEYEKDYKSLVYDVRAESIDNLKFSGKDFLVHDDSDWVLNTQVWEIVKNMHGLERFDHLGLGGDGLIEKIKWLERTSRRSRSEPIEVEIIGLYTNTAVLSIATMLKRYELAWEDDIIVTVDAKCCAGSTPELHKAALEVMKSCQINIIE